MVVRSIGINDYDALVRIHEQFYKDEFTFPDFVKHYLFAFVVEENGRIVTAAGLRTITEIVMMTDKNHSVKIRFDALNAALMFSIGAANEQKYDQIHAFVQDAKWEEHLKSVGFNNTKGNALVLEI